MDMLVRRPHESESFIDIIRQNLGLKQWQQLDTQIIRRFTLSPGGSKLRFFGVVNWVYCSPVGYLFGKLLKPFSLLPDRCARFCRFEFLIHAKHAVIKKQRKYFLNDTSAFAFKSIFTGQPTLMEEFHGRLGMYLKLSVKRGALFFQDRGYFWGFSRLRLPIPHWLTPGRFELLHRSIDEHRFQVIIRISHPLLGTLFYQRGEFFNRHITSTHAEFANLAAR